MSTTPSLLIVEDDPEIAALLSDLLEREGFTIRTAASGAAFDAAFRTAAPDLVLLDLMLPGEDGLSICRRVRAQSRVPIIILTAKGDEIDRIVGLELGADDYVAKPFHPRELVARISAVLRRSETATATGPQRLAFAGYRMDLAQRSLADPLGRTVDLSAGEFELLRAFVTHPQRVLTREQLLDLTRGHNTDAFDRAIDVQLLRLRRKIETDPAAPALIKTVRGSGYMFAATVREA